MIYEHVNEFWNCFSNVYLFTCTFFKLMSLPQPILFQVMVNHSSTNEKNNLSFENAFDINLETIK